MKWSLAAVKDPTIVVEWHKLLEQWGLVMVTEIFKCHPCMVKKEATTSEKKKDM
jgi:hypothetical protein